MSKKKRFYLKNIVLTINIENPRIFECRIGKYSVVGATRKYFSIIINGWSEIYSTYCFVFVFTNLLSCMR